MRRALFAVVTTAALGLWGCGGDDGDNGGTTETGSNGDADVTVIADDIAFDQDSYSTDAGSVAITLENEGSLNHTLLIDGVDDFKLSVAARGDTDSGTADLEAGEYVIYCDVSGHQAAGMEAALTVG